MTADRPIVIGLLGGESTGKSTLATDLAQTTGGLVAEEYLRDFVRDFKRLPTLADQEGIFLTQQATVNTVLRAAAHAGAPLVIADPAPLMTAVYSLVYFDDGSLLNAGVGDAHTYDLIVCCEPTPTWTPDGPQRDGPKRQVQAHQVLTDTILPRLSAEAINLVVATGTQAERLAQISDTLGLANT